MKASRNLKKTSLFLLFSTFFLNVFSTSFLMFFVGHSTTKNNFLKNLAVSHNFWPAYKMGSKPGKTMLILVLIFHFRGLFIDILKKINCNDELLINCWFFWLIHSWNWSFCHIRIFFTFFDRWSRSVLPWESNFNPKLDILHEGRVA